MNYYRQPAKRLTLSLVSCNTHEHIGNRGYSVARIQKHGPCNHTLRTPMYYLLGSGYPELSRLVPWLVKHKAHGFVGASGVSLVGCIHPYVLASDMTGTWIINGFYWFINFQLHYVISTLRYAICLMREHCRICSKLNVTTQNPSNCSRSAHENKILRLTKHSSHYYTKF